ncbi:MAG: Ankyrin repeat domain containing protein [candidate division TM6 bacterium GW2011_GWE2_42_60]|nr:MAG: Ankyrin repeat domain containing protein [candidate division TM6 bacterium GW2011_GWE2_42_60]HBY06055.1 hypothetical protein [Candidatus Dependentiae bacterium]
MNKMYFHLSLLAVMLPYFHEGVAMQNTTTTNTTKMSKEIAPNKRVFSDLDDDDNDLSIVSEDEDEGVEIEAPVATGLGNVKVSSNPPSLLPGNQIKKRRIDSSVGLNSTVSPVVQPAKTCSSKLPTPPVSSVPQTSRIQIIKTGSSVGLNSTVSPVVQPAKTCPSKLPMPPVSSVPQATISSVSTNTVSGISLFHKAVLEDKIGVIDFLGKNQQSLLEVTDIGGETPLLFAARLGKWEAVKKLIELGANVLAVDKNKNTVLHLATIAKKYDVISLLSPALTLTTPMLQIVKIAMLHCLINNQGETALQIAVKNNIDLDKKNTLSIKQLTGDKTSKK